jgi:membrane protease YdiL (CAAX protease family)
MRSSEAGVPGARPRLYAVGIAVEWTLAACVLALWVLRRRPVSMLGLGFSGPWRLAAGLAFFVMYAVLAFKQRRALIARPERLLKLFGRMPRAEALVPRTIGELRGFACLALTAGFCEELLFRGFVTWYVSLWSGSLLAIAFTSILFGLQHLYLGKEHVARAAVGGLLFGIVAVASGSLWPAILLHATVDLVAGDLGFRALGGPPPPAG